MQNRIAEFHTELELIPQQVLPCRGSTAGIQDLLLHVYQSFEHQPAGHWGRSACIGLLSGTTLSPHLCLATALCQLLLVCYGDAYATCQQMCPRVHLQPSSGSCAVCCFQTGTTHSGAALQSVLVIPCTLCVQAHQSPYIRHATQLEQWLMEGAYNKVLGAKSSAPDAAYATLMERLVSTVRCVRSPAAAGICCLVTGLFNQCKRLVLLDMVLNKQPTTLPIA